MPRPAVHLRHLAALLAALVLTATPAHALDPRAATPAIGPRKASDLVTLAVAGQSALPCLEVTERLRADGTRAPLVVPAGQVLVLTGTTFMAAGGATFDNVFLTVGTGSAFISPVPASAVALVTGASLDLHGIAVKPGVTLCLGRNLAGSFVFAHVYGFLAPDE